MSNQPSVWIMFFNYFYMHLISYILSVNFGIWAHKFLPCFFVVFYNEVGVCFPFQGLIIKLVQEIHAFNQKVAVAVSIKLLLGWWVAGVDFFCYVFINWILNCEKKKQLRPFRNKEVEKYFIKLWGTGQSFKKRFALETDCLTSVSEIFMTVKKRFFLNKSIEY